MKMKGLPQMAPYPDTIEYGPDDETEGGWTEFHQLVAKNCGAYLRAHGAVSMRDEIDAEHAKARKRSRFDRRYQEFLDMLEDDHLERMALGYPRNRR